MQGLYAFRLACSWEEGWEPWAPDREFNGNPWKEKVPEIAMKYRYWVIWAESGGHATDKVQKSIAEDRYLYKKARNHMLDTLREKYPPNEIQPVKDGYWEEDIYMSY